jgi:cystinosin
MTFSIMALGICIFWGTFEFLDLLYFLSYMKLGLTFMKYYPQAVHNYKRKNTKGISKITQWHC